ncbi:MAG TPA: hypothetical protein VK958_08630 [Methylophilus sp.]|uniref:hypothetical protein n=1 Tax=Methylophilus sp. TaxID=29541 RepID=UPI002BF877D9|nr:hypothetical protein [Methylophilus sp.]HSH87296.1 hypothetical protein [Methylophilus sp.]
MNKRTNFEKITVSQAIEKLFSIKLADYPKFKDEIHSLLRIKNFIEQDKKLIVQRETVHLYTDQLIKFHNAIILQAFFKPKIIISIFNDAQSREDASNAIELLIFDRHSILGVGLLSPEITRLLQTLRVDLDLTKEKLPNPFVQLPQLSLSGVTNIMKELLAQSAMLTLDESMVAYYLDGDLEKAFELAKACTANNNLVNKYKQRIISDYENAVEFEKTLDFFK